MSYTIKELANATHAAYLHPDSTLGVYDAVLAAHEYLSSCDVCGGDLLDAHGGDYAGCDTCEYCSCGEIH